MELDRPPHFRTTNTTTDLFICFTSRLSSSSSMKLSKSILSPARPARDPSLSTSLSRRLRTNGSLKAGQASPFLTTTATTTTGKKRGCAFDNPEPSSPKVTCIGQVRVKTKNKVKHNRSLSRRRSAGEVSFRKPDDEDKAPCSLQQQQQRHSNASAHYQQPPQECATQHRNQKWVHLPVSICEALRSFGAEFSCLFPCKSSSCFSTAERDKGGDPKQRNENGCGAVFARWMVSVNDAEGGKKQEIELVVGGEDEETQAERVPMRSSRRHVFEDIVVKDDRIEVKGQTVAEDHGEDEATAARVSICIPPKNALLLMRCRSDPMKMATLAGRFSWDAHAAPASQTTEKNIEEEDEFDEEKRDLGQQEEEKNVSVVPVEAATVTDEFEVEAASSEMEGGQLQQEEELAITIEEMVERELEKALHCECDDDHEETLLQEEEEEEEEEEQEEEEEEEVESNMSSFEALLDQEIAAEPYQNCAVEEDKDDEDEQEIAISHFAELGPDEAAPQDIQSPSRIQLDETPQEDTVEEQHKTTFVNDDQVPDPEQQVENPEIVASEEGQKAELEKTSAGVPECLLLMMCEPKLSMEVSKETWVCSTDFIRWLPERPRRSAKAAKLCDPAKARLDSKPKAAAIIPQDIQPPRSSCTLPAPASMTAMIEQKLVNAVGYEPFVLTRCKSEPMRTAAAKLVPESCYWKHSMAKQPHRRTTLGVGAAGVGF